MISRSPLVVAHGLLVLLFVACRSGNEPARTGTDEPGASVTPVASAMPSTVPTAPASSSASAPKRISPTLAELQQQNPSTDPPWPSGPGVMCGDARCKAGELCCGGAENRCLPKTKVKECLDSRSVAMECDESSDCGASEICCYGIIYEKESRHVACQTPAKCAIPLSRPGSFPFPGRELCGRGGSCRAPGLVCLDDDGMPSGGKCVSKIGKVACGDKICSDDRPWCLWDPGTRTAECIPRGPWLHVAGVHECDGSEDCVGEPCSTANGKSFCSMDSTEAFRFAGEACHKDADCPAPETFGSTRQVWKCEPADEDEALPGLEECNQHQVENP